MGLKVCKTMDIGETIRKIAWPNADDIAQKMYDSAKDKESVNLATSEIYSKLRKYITIGAITATLVTTTLVYLSGCDEQKTQDNNSAIKYSTSKMIK